ncbi:hypothetical protein ABTB66_03380 [Acinetobacter baumannii]
MKTVEKNSIQKNVDIIQRGDFDENHIRSLFISLREYCKGYKKLKEISHFVAHNKERNQGSIIEELEHRYLALTYMVHYLPPNPPLNPFKEFPSWIIELIKKQLKKINKKEFIDEFKFSQTTFLEKLSEAYIINQKRKIAIFSNKRFTTNFWKAIKRCLSSIHLLPLLTQDDLIKEIIGALKTNKININESLIRKQSNKITVCVLFLLHKTQYKFEGLGNGETFITYEQKVANCENNNNEGFGNLYIAGLNKIKDLDGKELEIQSYIFSTNLKAEEWCDPRLKFTQISEDNNEIKHLYIDDDLVLDNQLRITIPHLFNNGM